MGGWVRRSRINSCSFMRGCKMFKKMGALLTGIVPGIALAAPDVTAITGAAADVAVVAAAVFGVYVAIRAAKFIRRAL